MGATRSEARRALQEAATTGERAERCGNAECLGVAARNVGAASAAPEALRGEGASSDACLSSPAFHTASTSSMGRIFVDVCSGESTKIVSTRWMSLPIMPSASSSLPRIRLQLSATPWSTQAVSSSIVFLAGASGGLEGRREALHTRVQGQRPLGILLLFLQHRVDDFQLVLHRSDALLHHRQRGLAMLHTRHRESPNLPRAATAR
mmetsp:Transcript_18156/g.49817  ORF Transcript_18156/g.49817 Transcript_18156/m.49817 type:complete len:206 (+) Transcript_18156:485-1102(+)